MSDTPDILKRILRRKAEEIVDRCERVSLRSMSERAEAASTPRGFVQALEASVGAGRPAIIA